jgi:hypothetical protein
MAGNLRCDALAFHAQGLETLGFHRRYRRVSEYFACHAA